MPLKCVFVIMRCYGHSHALDIMLPLDQEGHNLAAIMFQATGSSCFVNISPTTINTYLVKS